MNSSEPLEGNDLRFSRRAVLAAPLGMLAACRRKKGTGFLGYAFVANEEGQNIAAVDLTAFAVARHIPLDAKPSAVIAHPSKPLVYALTPNPLSIYEISVDTLKLLRRTRTAGKMAAVKCPAAGDALWLITREPSQLVRLPLDRFQPSHKVELPGEPVDFDLSSNGEFAVVSLGSKGRIAVINLQQQPRIQGLIEVGQTVSRVLVRSDSKMIVAALPDARVLSLFDIPQGRLIVQLPLALRPDNLVAKSDGGQIFVTGEGRDAVVIVYPYSSEVAATLLAGKAPGALATCDSPEYLFVANPESGDVTVMNISTQRVIAVVRVGTNPCSITVTPDNQYALVLNRGSGDMAVIRIAALAARRLKAAPLFTLVPVGSAPVAQAVRGV